MTDPVEPVELDHPDLGADLRTEPPARRARLEIRTVLVIVAVLIVAGGLYVLLFGSPTRNRAVVDSTNTNPFSNVYTSNTSAPR